MRLGPLSAVTILALASLTACSMTEDDGSGEGATHDPALTGCSGSACATPSGGKPGEAAPTTAADTKKNGDETDVDCGGANAPKCADGKACAVASDCASGVCTNGTCAAPTGTDGVKNGDESDVDCGGTKTGAPRCAAGKTCTVHADCASDGCGYDKKCALAPSCTGHMGGDTCGAGEVGDPGAQHESCCAAAPIPGNTTMVLDKYVVTAGRFRAFAERFDGNLRSFTEKLNTPDWKPAWNDEMPTNKSEMNFLLGPNGDPLRRGCNLDSDRARTYWMSDAENAELGESGKHPFSKDVLDQKALNCVGFHLLQAFCIWDGGRLAKQAEFQAAWQGGEGRQYPWGAGKDTSKMNWQYSYSFPEVYDQGNFVFVGAPGRFPTGNAKNGHADLAGLLFEILSDESGGNVPWSGSGSWEGHPVVDKGAVSFTTKTTRAYWAAGGRCARPAQ